MNIESPEQQIKDNVDILPKDIKMTKKKKQIEDKEILVNNIEKTKEIKITTYSNPRKGWRKNCKIRG